MEVDTGASTSLLIWDTFQKIDIDSQFVLSSTKFRLQTYSKEIVSPKGIVMVEFLITDEKYSKVLGKDVLGMLRLN